MKMLYYEVTDDGLCSPVCPFDKSGYMIGSLGCQLCKYQIEDNEMLHYVMCSYISENDMNRNGANKC